MTKRVVIYKRVSTREQGLSKNGLEAQEAACNAFAKRMGYEIVEEFTEVASGKLDLNSRPILRAAVNRCKREKLTLVVSKLDRLSRSVAFITALMETSINFVVASFGENVSPFMLHVHASVDQLEREQIAQRTRDALAQVKIRLEKEGKRLGNPRKYDQEYSDGTKKLGYLSAAKIAGAANASKADEFALRMKPSIERMLAVGMSRTSIAKELNATSVKTQNGGAWHTASVCNIERRYKAL